MRLIEKPRLVNKASVGVAGQIVYLSSTLKSHAFVKGHNEVPQHYLSELLISVDQKKHLSIPQHYSNLGS